MENDIVRMLFLRRQRQKKRWKIKTISGAPPLSFKAKAGALKDYRIYGNTANGESVGDRTGNLFDGTVKNGNYTTNFSATNRVRGLSSTLINIGDTITVSNYSNINLDIAFCIVNENGKNQIDNDELLSFSNRLYDSDWQNNSFTYTSEYSGWIYLLFKEHTTTITKEDITNIMLNAGSTALPYEPYGYRVPVTISNGTDTLTTPIYLPEQIKKVGDEAEYIDYGEQKFVKKFYELTLNFDDMNNSETYPGWSGGTAVVEYCNKIRSLATDNPNNYMPIQYSSISNFTATFNVNSNNSILYLGNSIVIGHTQSELKEIYAGQSITFILKISDTDLDVTLPALPTLTGTNVLTVGTAVQPSGVEITGRIKI